ncbi:MAG TPA: NmrA family NAD(P)-binding protein [Chitinophaga sp.]|uniref:NmrA family NAD(P)-binding protein n=1 Tax=Chitinophaga sp. TaxID=1869181 RepID=UPI002CB2B165|nr:NmrA family NAD(P)-binding protein [Chitinophaga sp.]HVI44400.1 NmrA family NAD(P)-binding protein [Chitinophaga sp.]
MNYSTATVAVLGATGKTGSQVLAVLSDAGIVARALTRDLSNARQLPFTEWIQGDMNDTACLRTLLEGCNRLYLNSGLSSTMVEEQSRIIDEAKRYGVKYILRLSSPAARPDATDNPGKWHWQADEYLRLSGLQWNVLRPQSFMQNWLGELAASVKGERSIYEAAGGGKKAFIHTRDIGNVAAALFNDPGEWVNAAIPLSGPAAISYHEVAAAISVAIEEPVTYVELSPADARQRVMQKEECRPGWQIYTFLRPPPSVAEQLKNCSAIM